MKDKTIKKILLFNPDTLEVIGALFSGGLEAPRRLERAWKVRMMDLHIILNHLDKVIGRVQIWEVAQEEMPSL